MPGERRPGERSVAIIGLGIMGGTIARNLIAAGFTVSGFDVDPSRTGCAGTPPGLRLALRRRGRPPPRRSP